MDEDRDVRGELAFGPRVTARLFERKMENARQKDFHA